MKRVATELMAAARSADRGLFAAAVRKYADVEAIGQGALGSYKVRPDDQSTYERGLVSYISKYAADKAPEYPVAKAPVVARGPDRGGKTYVDTQVHVNGTFYDVRWHLVRAGETFKIRDAVIDIPILGKFSCVERLGQMFQNYIVENGGNPRVLVIALNR